jgi:phosphoserine phosphatase
LILIQLWWFGKNFFIFNNSETLSILLGRAAETDEIRQKIEEITQEGNRGNISMIESYQTRLALAKPSQKLFEEFMEELKLKVTPGFEQILSKVRKEFPSVQIIMLVLSF